MPGRKWWKTVKQVTGDKVYSGIPTLIENGSPIIDSIEKANIFNEYFSSQCQLPDGSNDHPLPPFRYEADERLANITFFPSDIHTILTNLDVNKATGPDKIRNFLLKNVADYISEPLCKIFNYSIQNSTFPSMWKKSSVIPIHKKNDTKDKQNYRPVSSLCNVSKVFERLIYDKLYTFLISNNLLTDKNSGFRSGDGTLYQLLAMSHELHEALDNGHDMRIVFMDMSKAFDKVWHKGVIFKLKRKGIDGLLLKWFISYLENRFQRVVIDGQSSVELPVQTGVPQDPWFFLYTWMT